MPDISALEDYAVQISVVNRKSMAVLGYLSLPLVTIYHQDKSTMVNQRFNLLLDNHETNQEILLSLNLAVQSNP